MQSEKTIISWCKSGEDRGFVLLKVPGKYSQFVAAFLEIGLKWENVTIIIEIVRKTKAIGG